MIIRWICVQLLSCFVSGQSIELDYQRPRIQDYTFVLVHNLSDIGDWNAFLSNPSQYNPSLLSPYYPVWPPPIPGVQRPPTIPGVQRPPTTPWVQRPPHRPSSPKPPTTPATTTKPPGHRPPKPIGSHRPPSNLPPKPIGSHRPPSDLPPKPIGIPKPPATTFPDQTPKPESGVQSISDEQCGMRGTKGPRIVGGTDAAPAEFPWQVSLQLKISSTRRPLHICGGAVLTHYWVVTAAHCTWELTPERLTVVAGDYDLYVAEGHEQRVAVSRIVTYDYRRESFSNDIALLQLKAPLKIDHKWISPICLPKSGKKFTKGDSVVSGWGRLSESGSLPHVLQHVTLPILNIKRCQELYRKAGYSHFLNTCQLCSGYEQGGRDSCQGDSGGPLTCRQRDGRYYLCGVVSWGVGCARPAFPGMYTEVSCHTEWIKQVIYNEDNVLANAPAVANIARRKRPRRPRPRQMAGNESLAEEELFESPDYYVT